MIRIVYSASLSLATKILGELICAEYLDLIVVKDVVAKSATTGVVNGTAVVMMRIAAVNVNAAAVNVNAAAVNVNAAAVNVNAVVANVIVAVINRTIVVTTKIINVLPIKSQFQSNIILYGLLQKADHFDI